MFLMLMVLAAILFLIGAVTAAKWLLIIGLVCLLVGLIGGANDRNYWRRH